MPAAMIPIFLILLLHLPHRRAAVRESLVHPRVVGAPPTMTGRSKLNAKAWIIAESATREKSLAK
jgi:hypothetical protein